MHKALVGGGASPQMRINKDSETDTIYVILLKSTINGRFFISYHTPIFQLKPSKFVYEENF